MSIKTKMKINFAIFMTLAGYMLSHDFQTFLVPIVREYLTLKM